MAINQAVCQTSELTLTLLVLSFVRSIFTHEDLLPRENKCLETSASERKVWLQIN